MVMALDYLRATLFVFLDARVYSNVAGRSGGDCGKFELCGGGKDVK